ncbi:hypothetical protein V2A60_009499 [Cordyceps javanica]
MSRAVPPHGGDAPPPYSETDIYSNSGAAAAPSSTSSAPPPTTADDVASRMSSSNEEIIYTPPDTPRTGSAGAGTIIGVAQPGADLYFETRPPPPPDVIPPSTLVHALQLDAPSLPDDFPFPSDWEKRDVNAQDWATFINFLLPDHTTRGNDVVLERKLRAEAESEAGDSVSSGRSQQAELQRHLLRTAGPEALRDEAQRRANALATVHEWNAGFFGPRGITVMIAPGGDDEIHHAASTRGGQGQPDAGSDPRLPDPTSFRMDADGITYGRRFVMDSNGIRIGSLIMDAGGIRMASHENDAPGTSHEAGAGSSSRNMPGFSGTEPPPRGRTAVNVGVNIKGKDKARDRSASSVSSVSSASSSSSVSSLDSLPDYDDVREQQLPAYLGILQDWTSKPNHLRTNTDVAWLKNELKSARSQASGPHADKKVLKSQIKALLKQWKQIQREQHKAQRDTRSARKKQRRQEKRERRQWKRDMKRSQRDVRRAERDARRHGGHVHHPPGPPSLPPLPYGSSSMPAPPPMPSMPAMPHGMMHGSPSRGFHDHRPHQHRHHREHGFGSRGSWGHRDHGGFGRGGFSGAWPSRGPHTHTSWAGRHQPPGGCWSVDGDRHNEAQSSSSPPPPPPNPAIAAKYTAAQSIEDAIRTQQEKADKMDAGPGRDAIHSAIASMTQSLESLRVDADAEYARHVADSHIAQERSAAAAAAAQERSAIATASWWTTDKGCLSFQPGAKITDVRFPSDNWWHGTYKGQSGFFPPSHVKLLPM